MRSLRLTFAATAMTVFAVLGVACGDDDQPTPTAVATPTAADGEAEIVLYFPKSTATDFQFVPVVRTVTGSPDPQGLVRLLLSGPTPQEESSLGVSNPFPAGVRLLSLDLEGDSATVDFSIELLDYGGGSANVIAISESITRTVQEATGAATVVILVEGEPDQLQP